MRKSLKAVFGAVLMAGALTVGALAADQTLEGTVTDAMCGAKHHGDDAAACIKGCVSHGSKYGLVVGDKVYELSGKEDDLAKLGAGKAKVTGTVNGMKVDVKSVAPAS
jgi:hypothetical protein